MYYILGVLVRTGNVVKHKTGALYFHKKVLLWALGHLSRLVLLSSLLQSELDSLFLILRVESGGYMKVHSLMYDPPNALPKEIGNMPSFYSRASAIKYENGYGKWQ